MTLTAFRGRCHTCGHDHDADDERLRDLMRICDAAERERRKGIPHNTDPEHKGYERGCAESAAALQAVLDGTDTGEGECIEPWATQRRKLLALKKLAAFGAWCSKMFLDDGVDATEAYGEMLRLGVLEAYSPKVPCCDECRCVEYGELPPECHRFAPDVMEAMK